jgi:hypothetical protein
VSNPAKGGSTPIASRSASPKSYPSNSPPRRPDGEGSSISAYLRLRSHIAKILVQVSSAAIVSKTARSGKQKPYWVPEKTLSSYLAAALSSACFSSPGMWDETRPKKMREQIEAMKEIWTKDRPEYHGEFVSFPPMMTWPKPVQKPHPPIIVGGAFRLAARRAIPLSISVSPLPPRPWVRPSQLPRASRASPDRTAHSRVLAMLE